MSSITSDFNLQKINTKEFSENLAATIDFGGALFAVARRGTGKTSITREVIAQANCKEVYFNLALKERPDIGGYPNFFSDKHDRYIDFRLPSIYKDLMDGDKPCVVVFDEIDKADSGLLGPLLEFVQEKSIDGQKLKNLKAIIMTGNLPAEGGSKPPPTLLDRAEKFLVEADPRHWLDWASTIGKIHPSIAAFIADNLNALFGEIDLGEDYSDASPRGWDKASQLVTFGERRKWSNTLLLQKVAACVGKRNGIKYGAFFEHYKEILPAVDKIMNGHHVQDFDSFEATKKLIVSMVMCARFAKMLDDIKDNAKSTRTLSLTKDVEVVGGNIANFMYDNLDPEVTLIAIRGQLGARRVLDFNLTDDPNWDKVISDLLSKISV